MNGTWKLFAIAIAVAFASLAAPVASAAEYRIDVDGITGEVKAPVVITANPRDKKERYRDLVFEPGDRVQVRVVRANLITYGYRITLGKEEVLEVHHIVIGGPVLTDADIPTAADLQREGTVEDAARSMKVSSTLIDEYERIARSLREVHRRLAELESTVQDTEAEINGNMCPPGSGWPAELLNTRSQVYCALTGKAKKTAKGCVDSPSGLTAAPACAQPALRSMLGQIEDDLAALSATLDVTPQAPNDTGFAGFQSAVNGLQTSLADTRLVADKLQRTVDRWQDVILAHPDATVSNTFLIDDISKRYTVVAHRFDPENPPEEGEEEEQSETETTDEDEDSTDDAAEETIANVVFEGHAFSRLNFALGLAHAYRSHNDSFEIVNSVGADDKVTAHVQRKTHDTILTKPIASLGVYLFRVDGQDRNRGPVPMLSVGVEVAESPDYFAGLGLDWPSGLTLSLGVTRYQKTQLAPGWSVGQAVPLKEDGTPLLAAPITNSSTALAPYLAIQFRPTIFRAFSKLFKAGD